MIANPNTTVREVELYMLGCIIKIDDGKSVIWKNRTINADTGFVEYVNNDCEFPLTKKSNKFTVKTAHDSKGNDLSYDKILYSLQSTSEFVNKCVYNGINFT